jgi:Na+/citrate or Na+/malate symporter
MRRKTILLLVFAIYCFGVFGYVAQEQFNKILYLGSKYIYTVIGTVIVVLLKLLVDTFAESVVVITASTSLLLMFYAVFVAFSIKKVIGNYLNKEVLLNVVKILGAGACALVVFAVFKLFAPSFVEHKILFFVPLISCGLVYAAVLFFTGIINVIIRKEKNEDEKA